MAANTSSGTHHIFDLVFKRLVQEASFPAVVALVNGLFATHFPLDSPVSFPNKETVTEDLRQIVSDMMILIAGEVFHLEAQIDDDLNMALRIFRYGYHEAVNKPAVGGGREYHHHISPGAHSLLGNHPSNPRCGNAAYHLS